MDLFDLDNVLHEYITFFSNFNFLTGNCQMPILQFEMTFHPRIQMSLKENGCVAMGMDKEGNQVVRLTSKGCMTLLMRQAEICIQDRKDAEIPCVW